MYQGRETLLNPGRGGGRERDADVQLGRFTTVYIWRGGLSPGNGNGEDEDVKGIVSRD